MKAEFFQAFRATFVAIFSDKAALSVIFGAVLIYSFFYPLGYQEEVAAGASFYVVDEDNSALSRQLVRYLDSVRAIEVDAVVASPALAVAAVERMQTQGYVLIPKGFERDTLRLGQGQVGLFANGAWLGRASAELGGIAEALRAFAVQSVIKQSANDGINPPAPPIKLVQRPLFNTQEGYGSALVTGVAELIVQQTLLVGLALLAGTRRELYGRLFLRHSQILGIGSAAWLIASLNMLYYAGFVFWYQDYPSHGSLGMVLFSSLLYSLAVVAFGLFITSFFRVRERAYQLILITTLPFFFLSNLSWPEVSTPWALVWLAKLIPSTPGINLMIKATQYGASWHEAMQEILNLLVLILGYGSLGWWRYHFYKAGKHP